jgi:hypothetical protein
MRIAAVLSLLAALVVNYLANSLPLGGYTPVELSDMFPNYFVPAGVAFSIWGIIYLGLMIWAGVQFIPSRRRLGKRMAPLFALSSLLNASWLLVWHQQWATLSVLVMFGLLATLVRIQRLLFRQGIGALTWPGAGLARWAFGIYTGWVLVASVLNVTVYLVGVGWTWERPGALAAAFVIIPVAALVGGFVLYTFRNPWIGVAVAWGLSGIALNRWTDQPALGQLALGLAIAMVLFALVTRVMASRQNREPEIQTSARAHIA